MFRISALEKTPQSVGAWAAAFAGVVCIRFVLEHFSTTLSQTLPAAIVFVETALFYALAALSTILIASVANGKAAVEAARASVFFLPLMWIGPFFDLLTPWIAGAGARVEFLVFLACVGAYSHAARRDLLRTAMTVALSGGAAWWWLWVSRNVGVEAASRIFVLALFAIAAALLAWSNRSLFAATLRNSRPERVMHYFGMAALGVIAAELNVATAGRVDVPGCLALMLAIYCAWMFAVGVNDIVDIAIDEVSNPDRPLIKGEMTRSAMSELNVFFLTLSLVAAFVAGEACFLLICAFTAAYYIYSAPPLMLKRAPVLATFLISLACLSSALAGYSLASQGGRLAGFPPRLALLIVAGFTFAGTLKDIKDIDGDRAAGIATIPVLLGERRGKVAVGLLTAVCLWSVPLILDLPLLAVTSIPAGVACYVLITRRSYSERPVFVVYLIYLAASAALVTMKVE